jgi:hypothetical protein
MRALANVSIVMGTVLLMATTLFMMASLALVLTFGVPEAFLSVALAIAMAPLGMVIAGVLIRRVALG